MVEGPKRDQRREARRAMSEALAQTIPLTAGLARLYQTTHPSESEIERQRWESDVTDELNKRSSEKVITFGRIDFDGSKYSSDHTQNVSSFIDEGVGILHVNFAVHIEEPYIVEIQADHGDVAELQKNAYGFRLQIRNENEPFDAGFVFLIKALPC